MLPIPNRRWLRFSLPTLFIVVTALAVVAIPLAWAESNRRLAYARPRILSSFLKRGAGFEIESSYDRELPWILSHFGSRHFGANIELPRDRFTEQDRNELQRAIPEVDVLIVDRAPQQVP